MHLPMLFKLGRQIKNDGLHMQVIFFFRHQIQDDRLPAILVEKNYPRVGVGDGHLYNTTSSQCSVMTEDYCAAPLRSLV